MRDQLFRTIGDAGQNIHEERTTDGSRLLVLPHGGRILGLFGPRSDENFFWTNPALEDVKTARKLFEGEGWHNTGGDRTWLAPEVDFFLPEYPKLDRYLQPKDLDAADYSVDRSSGRLALRNRVRATLSRSRIELTVEVHKEVESAPNPLRRESDSRILDDLEYAGYTLRTVIRLLERRGAGEAWFGGWSLLQLPHGGELLAPTYSSTTPRIYFGELDPQDLVVGERMVLWRMRKKGEHKIGIRAFATTGRAGYLRESKGFWSLVVRNFPVNPSGEYVDVPAGDPTDLGYAFQACSVDSALGAFSELEHHAQASSLASGRDCEDFSQVWAYRGRLESVRRVTERLLGPAPSAMQETRS